MSNKDNMLPASKYEDMEDLTPEQIKAIQAFSNEELENIDMSEISQFDSHTINKIIKVEDILASYHTALLIAMVSYINPENVLERDKIVQAAENAALVWKGKYLPALLGKEKTEEILNASIYTKSE